MGGKIEPGGYAVVGAAAFSAAVTGKISIAVVVFELTEDLATLERKDRQGAASRRSVGAGSSTATEQRERIEKLEEEMRSLRLKNKDLVREVGRELRKRVCEVVPPLPVPLTDTRPLRTLDTGATPTTRLRVQSGVVNSGAAHSQHTRRSAPPMPHMAQSLPMAHV